MSKSLISQIFEYLKGKDDFVGRLLHHMGTSAVMDLLLRLITCIESVDIRKAVIEVCAYRPFSLLLACWHMSEYLFQIIRFENSYVTCFHVFQEEAVCSICYLLYTYCFELVVTQYSGCEQCFPNFLLLLPLASSA